MVTARQEPGLLPEDSKSKRFLLRLVLLLLLLLLLLHTLQFLQ